MSENRDDLKNEEVKEEVKDDKNLDEGGRETIDSIEKTVEDLKRKIQEISDHPENEKEEDDRIDIPSFANEQKKKLNEIRESTVKSVSDTVENFKKNARNVKNSDDLNQAVKYIKNNAVKAMDGAKGRIQTIREDPKVKDASDKALSALQEAGRAAGEAAGQAAKAAQEFFNTYVNEDTKKSISEGLDKASQAINEGTRNVMTSFDEFINRPDVQDALQKMKDGADDLAKKGEEVVNSILKNKDEHSDGSDQ